MEGWKTEWLHLSVAFVCLKQQLLLNRAPACKLPPPHPTTRFRLVTCAFPQVTCAGPCVWPVARGATSDATTLPVYTIQCGRMHPQGHDFQTKYHSWRPPHVTHKEQAI